MDSPSRRFIVNRNGIILLALCLDYLLGDPPSRVHPVAWMGRWIDAIRRHAPRVGEFRRFLYGAVSIAGSAIALGWSMLRWQQFAPFKMWSWLVNASLLSLLLSLRSLLRAGTAVANPLAAGDLPAARHQLSWHLVSRDTSCLNASQIAAATVESLAENTSDSVIAPIFWYVIAGLPGALVYRFLNTADAMLGYRDIEREWLGKAAARLDDVANLIPARLTALGMILSAPWVGGRIEDGWRIWQRDAGATASPNAGHPMSAAAGVLGVELEKIGHYRLGAELCKPTTVHIKRMQRLSVASVGVCFVFLVGIDWVWQRIVNCVVDKSERQVK